MTWTIIASIISAFLVGFLLNRATAYSAGYKAGMLYVVDEVEKLIKRAIEENKEKRKASTDYINQTRANIKNIMNKEQDNGN